MSPEFFSSHAKINAVRMRRHLTSKDFKGSVFVEAASEEEAKRVCRGGVRTGEVGASKLHLIPSHVHLSIHLRCPR